jgi:hypothetical protein
MKRRPPPPSHSSHYAPFNHPTGLHTTNDHLQSLQWTHCKIDLEPSNRAKCVSSGTRETEETRQQYCSSRRADDHTTQTSLIFCDISSSSPHERRGNSSSPPSFPPLALSRAAAVAGCVKKEKDEVRREKSRMEGRGLYSLWSPVSLVGLCCHADSVVPFFESAG